jgi:putative transposase
VTDAAVLEMAPMIGTVAACTAAGRPRATHYRRHRLSPGRERPVPVAHVDRAQPSALSTLERADILSVLHSERFCDAAPAQVWATLLDEGIYLGSQSTFYRLLRTVHGDVRERRSQATHPAKVKPELVAHGPNQVWSWDFKCRRRHLMSYADLRTMPTTSGITSACSIFGVRWSA